MRRRAWKLSRRSFASLVSPSLLWFVVRRARTFDVVHVHLARDLLTLPVAAMALLLRIPLVLQTHGMIVTDPRRSVRLLDALLTRRVLKRAAVLLALTPQESDALQQLDVPRNRITLLGNAAPLIEGTASFKEDAPLVLYVSRLAERKRPVAFVEMAAEVAAERSDVRFAVWGPDGGQLSDVRDAIARHDLQGTCVYRGAAPSDRIPEILLSGQALVLPSFAEPYPMVVLESAAAGLPCVITTDTGLSQRLGEAGAAVVTDGSPREMAGAVLDLLGSRSAWSRTSDAARALVRAEFGAGTLAEALVSHYVSAVRGSTDRIGENRMVGQ